VTKGDVALTADIPDGTSAGGNARGVNAVDLQMSRAGAAQVASGENSAILGGINNTASGQRAVAIGGSGNNASGSTSIAFGQSGAASGSFSSVIGGQNGAASSNYSTTVGGLNATASAFGSIVAGGEANTASSINSITLGGWRALANLNGMVARAYGSFNGSSPGDAQTSDIRLRRAITGESAAELTIDGGAPAAGTRAILNLPTGATAGRVWNARIQLVAVVQTLGSGPDSIALGSAFIGDYMVGIKRIGNTTSLVGSVQTLGTPQADNGMETSVVTITADDTNESLKIEFTPPDDAVAATVIRVVATVYLTEVGY
jgi:hypothetical protein